MASVHTLVGVRPHIQDLLAELHKASSSQEAAIDPAERADASKFHALMRDKFIALDEDKSQYVYQLLRSINAKTIVEAIDLREGDLRETLKTGLESVDALLLDIWPPMALPTLKLVQPKFRYGAVVIIDNTVSSFHKYTELLTYIRGPDSGFVNTTLPFAGGLDVCVYLPQK